MACTNCAKIRSLVLHGKMAEAAGLTIETLREKVGFREPVEVTVEGLRTTLLIDAETDHRLAAASPLELSIPDLTDYLETVTDPAVIEALIEAEKAGKNRGGAVAALEDRRDELSAEA